MFLRHSVSVEIPGEFKDVRFLEKLCLTSQDDVVLVTNSAKSSLLLHYSSSGKFVKSQRFETPILQACCLYQAEILLLQPSSKSIVFWNVLTSAVKKASFEFASANIYHQKLHCFADASCYCIEEPLPDHSVRLTFLRYPSTELKRVRVEDAGDLTFLPFNSTSKMCHYKKLCTRLELAIVDFVKDETLLHFIDLKSQHLVRSVHELKEGSILLYCSNQKSKQNLLVYSTDDEKIREFGSRLNVLDHIFDVKVAGSLVYVFTMKPLDSQPPKQDKPTANPQDLRSGDALLIDKTSEELLMKAKSTLHHTYNYTFHGGSARHFLVEMVAERHNPKSIRVDLCRKVGQRELYVWLLKQIGGLRKDMIEHVLDAFADHD